MNKVLVLIFLIAAGLSACQKESDKPLFNESPDERLNETLTAYQNQLSGAENGWKALITTDSGKGATYSFYFKFNNENRVVMVSDFDSASAVTPKESSYRLKALQQPSLIFDTYSYLHVLADPDASQNGGAYGGGLFSDFEFYFDSTTTDTIKLVGRFNGSKMILVRATKAEEDAYNKGALAAGLYINKILTYFKRLTIGTQVYDIKINPVTRQITFYKLDANGGYLAFTTRYYFIAGGMIFTPPVVNGTQIISGFTNITWNQSIETINLTVDGTAATITGIVFPLKVDVAAPKGWWDHAVNNANTYWFSPAGFHVNGVDDAFGITTLDRYYYLIYWPEYDTGNDLFAPVFLDSTGTRLELHYGAAPATPTFTTDGIAKFTLLGNYGTYPTTGPAALSKNQLLIPEGYYFVKTGENSYDMISAKDGKAWISWLLAL